ncbi:MAG: hypothetical protein JSV42_13335 [Chloroflexota bacterium]|nr:MAG: hypothetical protein JSV42_13335 [Chloroflexota bacterium]
MKVKSILSLVLALVFLLAAFPASGATLNANNPQAFKKPSPKFSEAVAFDETPGLRDLAQGYAAAAASGEASQDLLEIRPDRGPDVKDQGFAGDGALQGGVGARFASPDSAATAAAASISSPLANFEGLSNQDNFNLFGFRVNPPDPVGDVGPNHYVEMINLAFAVYDKQGNLLLGPAPIGALWEGFEVEDCTDPSGDPIVLYDQLEDRWILSQFTTRGFDDPTLPFYDCVAISQTGDPTGAYYRYAFITQPDTAAGFGYFFPDYPKYGVWTDSYIMTTRDFGVFNQYGISVYALEKNKMLEGNPKARAVQFFLDSNEVPVYLIGDGLLPPDIDGTRRPKDRVAAPIVGTMDDNAFYGAPFDALNIWELWVQWKAKPQASLNLATQLPVAQFDSVFPCGPSRGCIPQPGITNPDQWLDILSYRQRPTHRLAYRNFGGYEALVTNQSVEAAPGMAGVRWYEIRRTGGTYSVHQQGTYAPGDGVHRWMGSAAMDWQGNMAIGYSVSNATDVYPGIRYTGRLSGDPLGQMSLGEGVIINGTGVQTTTNSRWGDYTSLNVDPVDDCTFWYVNEYYEISGFPVNPNAPTTAPWQTRIASFKLPGCEAKTD